MVCACVGGGASQGIWGSGLSISAAMGVRDSNEASWTQVLEVLDFMSECTDIPILLDGDTGYGNFNNARRLISKLEARGIAGVCLEDKLFPKTNSLLEVRLRFGRAVPRARCCSHADCHLLRASGRRHSPAAGTHPGVLWQAGRCATTRR